MHILVFSSILPKTHQRAEWALGDELDHELIILHEATWATARRRGCCYLPMPATQKHIVFSSASLYVYEWLKTASYDGQQDCHGFTTLWMITYLRL